MPKQNGFENSVRNRLWSLKVCAFIAYGGVCGNCGLVADRGVTEFAG